MKHVLQWSPVHGEEDNRKGAIIGTCLCCGEAGASAGEDCKAKPMPTDRLRSILMHARELAKLPLDLQPYGLDDTFELLAEIARLRASREEARATSGFIRPADLPEGPLRDMLTKLRDDLKK